MNAGDDIRAAVRRDSSSPPSWALGPGDTLSDKRMVALGNVIKERRIQRMFAVEAFAAQAGLPERTVHAAENAQLAAMPLGVLYAIAAALGVTPSGLLADAEREAQR